MDGQAPRERPNGRGLSCLRDLGMDAGDFPRAGIRAWGETVWGDRREPEGLSSRRTRGICGKGACGRCAPNFGQARRAGSSKLPKGPCVGCGGGVGSTLAKGNMETPAARVFQVTRKRPNPPRPPTSPRVRPTVTGRWDGTIPRSSHATRAIARQATHCTGFN